MPTVSESSKSGFLKIRLLNFDDLLLFVRLWTLQSCLVHLAERGSIDPFIGINFKLGPPVDPSGILPDNKSLKDIKELQTHLAADPDRLLRNLAMQLAVYGTGRPIAFSDRKQINGIVSNTRNNGGGIRTLLHELVQSPLFQTR